MFTRPQGIALKNLSQEACGTDWQASLLVASRLCGPAGRSITKAVIQIGSNLPRIPKTAALGVLLILSALLTAATLRLPGQQWLAWISFLPLFVVVLGGTGSIAPEPRASARAVLQNQDYSDSLPQGLITGLQPEGPHRDSRARLVAYVSTAFLVASVNASLVGMLGGARLSFPAYRSLGGSANTVGWLPSQVVRAIQSWTLRQAHPRAPPIPVATVS